MVIARLLQVGKKAAILYIVYPERDLALFCSQGMRLVLLIAASCGQ